MSLKRRVEQTEKLARATNKPDGGLVFTENNDGTYTDAAGKVLTYEQMLERAKKLGKPAVIWDMLIPERPQDAPGSP